ncbi:MAG: hypothetical protein ACYTDY_00645 [Planctomycetota bacterium]|jgi:hypothetical protein
MARSPLTDALAKRDHLHSERVTDEERNACADVFIGEARYGEALEYLEVTRDAERLDKIHEIAVEAGDTFLLSRIEKIRGKPIPAETWRIVAERALRREKFYDAARAYERAGDPDRAEQVLTEHTGGFQPWKPEGK